MVMVMAITYFFRCNGNGNGNGWREIDPLHISDVTILTHVVVKTPIKIVLTFQKIHSDSAKNAFQSAQK
jgi:hypothetical protein